MFLNHQTFVQVISAAAADAGGVGCGGAQAVRRTSCRCLRRPQAVCYEERRSCETRTMNKYHNINKICFIIEICNWI